MKQLQTAIINSWSPISFCWPLKNSIAANPLAGFTDLDFEKALRLASSYFQTKSMPEELLEINRQSIKWLQLFYDTGEAAIPMPGREPGLLSAVCNLLPFDSQIFLNKEEQELLSLSSDPEKLIADSLSYLQIEEIDHEQFLTLLLTTLPGWASYTNYYINYSDTITAPVTATEYLAFRILLTRIIWPKAKNLLIWHTQEAESAETVEVYNSIVASERAYQKDIINKLSNQKKQLPTSPFDAQFIFCIDTRMEQLRRCIEDWGNYETLSMAGFFCLPIMINNQTTDEIYASCSPIIQPECTVIQTKRSTNEKRSLYSNQSFYNIDAIPLEKQIEYAKKALATLGITTFAPIIVFCGHSGSSENNSYKTTLDCGACGARNGLPNAEIIVQILNTSAVKQALNIPEQTDFFAAHYNTTTETFSMYKLDQNQPQQKIIHELLQLFPRDQNKLNHSHDWSQLQPEWALAGNASLIIGPGWLTKNIDLDGRAFLHSYDHEKDTDGSILTSILLGSGMVAHTINCQYLFSTIDNTAFGSGSKTTQNVVGKIGIMQGNGSDLMHGLPHEAVYTKDGERYHAPVRLTIFIVAERQQIDKIISEQEKINTLLKNRWIFILCIDPHSGAISRL